MKDDARNLQEFNARFSSDGPGIGRIRMRQISDASSASLIPLLPVLRRISMERDSSAICVCVLPYRGGGHLPAPRRIGSVPSWVEKKNSP